MDLEGTVSTLYRIELPENVAEGYEREADARNLPVELILAERLIRTSAYNATKPLYIDDAARQELERLLSRNFNKPKDLIREITKLVTVKVGNVQVHLDQDILYRMKGRHFSDLSFDDWMAQQIRELIEQFVGMR